MLEYLWQKVTNRVESMARDETSFVFEYPVTDVHNFSKPRHSGNNRSQTVLQRIRVPGIKKWVEAHLFDFFLDSFAKGFHGCVHLFGSEVNVDAIQFLSHVIFLIEVQES